jgi:hypothetical protein
MRKHHLSLARRQSWCVSTDPEFSRKAADVVGLYLNPPENALVLCVDEKPWPLPLIVAIAVWLWFHSSWVIGIFVANVLLVIILSVGSERR